MNYSGWLVILPMGGVLGFLGYRGWQIVSFPAFILVFGAAVAVSLLLFWLLWRKKPHP